MKTTAWIIISMVLLIAGCGTDSEKYTFANQFAELQIVDQQYNASFKFEKLDRQMVPLENIDPLLEELKEKKQEVEKADPANETEAIIDFIEIRKLMLLAQKNFQLGAKIGDIGSVSDAKGYSCSEAKYILDAAYYFNETWSYGVTAESRLDDLLFKYAEVPQLQALVGLDENKTAFYNSPLDQIKNIARNNYEALGKNCKIRVVTN